MKKQHYIFIVTGEVIVTAESIMEAQKKFEDKDFIDIGLQKLLSVPIPEDILYSTEPDDEEDEE